MNNKKQLKKWLKFWQRSIRGVGWPSSRRREIQGRVLYFCTFSRSLNPQLIFYTYIYTGLRSAAGGKDAAQRIFVCVARAGWKNSLRLRCVLYMKREVAMLVAKSTRERDVTNRQLNAQVHIPLLIFFRLFILFHLFTSCTYTWDTHFLQRQGKKISSAL